MKRRTHKPSAPRGITPEDILAPHPRAIRRCAGQLRKLVRAAAPEAVEVAYPGWHAIGYRHPACGYFCGIFPYEDRIKLIFEFGAWLDDPLQLLQGETKQVRFLEYQPEQEIAAAPLNFFIAQALGLRVRKRRA